jgi:hypothetical protein
MNYNSNVPEEQNVQCAEIANVIPFTPVDQPQ